MADFDLNNYFNKRFGNTGTDKIKAIVDASQEKVIALGKYRDQMVINKAENDANEAAAQLRNSSSVLGVLQDITGVSNDGVLASDGLLGAPINNAVAMGAGLSGLTGYVASGINDLNAMDLNKDIPQEVKDARARMLAGTATDADMQLLALPRGDVVKRPETTDYMHKVRKDFKTNLEQITDMETSLDRAVNARKFFDLSGAVHTGTKDALTKDLGESANDSIAKFSKGIDQVKDGKTGSGLADMAVGLGGALSEIPGAAMRNKQGAVTFLAENAANLAASGLGKIPQALSNIGYGLDAFGQGVDAQRTANHGAIPTNEDLAWKAGLAATAVAAEYAGDKLSGVTDLFKPAKKAVADEAKTALKKALGLVDNVVTRTAGAAVKGGSGEFLTEGYQTWAENAMKMEDTTLKQAYEGGAIGAIIGGGTGTVAHIGSELTGTTPDKIKDRQAALKDSGVTEAAVTANDPSVYLDPTARSYNPTKAAEVLLGHARLDTTTPEVRQENLTKAKDLVTGLEEKLQQAMVAYDRASESTFDKAATQTQLVAFKERLDSLDQADPANAKMVKGLTEAIQLHEMTLTASESKTNLKLQKAKADALAKQVVQVTNVKDALAEVVRGKTSMAEVQKTVIAANATVAANDAPAMEAAQKAVNKVISLSMVNLSSLSVEAANDLADNTSNSLTAPQRQYLREFSKARQAENKAKNVPLVSQDVFLGSPGSATKTRQLGIKDYNKNIGQALEAKDQITADKQLDMLNNFVEDHLNKLEQVSAAYRTVRTRGDAQIARVKEAGKPDKWIRVAKPDWSRSGKAELRDSGGLEVHSNSDQLLNAIELEAHALQQTLKTQQAAYNLTFQGNSAVQPTTTPTVATTATQAAGVAQAAEVVGGATQTNTQGKSSVVKPVAQTAAAPTSVAPVGSAVESAASPLTKNVSVLENAEDKARVSVKSLPLAVTEPTNYSEILSTLDILFSESTPEEQQALLDAFTNEQEQYESAQEASQTQDSTANQDTEGSGSVQVVATGETNETTGRLEGQDSKASEGGKLSVLSQYQDKLTGTVNEVFRTVNLVAQYFKQNGVNETNLANKPLVGVKDFLSAWDKSFDLVKEYLDLGKDKTLFEEQESALNNFGSTVQSWMPAIQANFKKYTGSVDFKSNDMMQYLYNEGDTVDVDENVKTAIAYSAYRWIMDKGNSPIFMTSEQVNEMHNQDKDLKIDPTGLATLQRMASFKDTAIAELGKVAAQSLGLALRDDAPVDLLPKLESALGAHVLGLLEKEGYLKQESLLASEVNAWFGVDTPAKYSDENTYHYVKLITQMQGKKPVHIDKVRGIKAANQGSGDVVNKLFGVTIAPRMPDTKPSKLVQKTAKDSDQDIPKIERKAIQATMNVPHTIIQDMWAVAQMLGRDAILNIAGAKDLESGKYHEINRPSIEAQNQNVGNQYDMMDELLHQSSNENGFEQAFYVMQSVWKNFRAGFSNQAMNLQTSKIHRFMFARPNWTVKIDFDNQALVDEFLVSVAMALGIKTDQQRNTGTMVKFEEHLLEKPEVMQAVKVLQEAITNGDTALLATKDRELVQDVAASAEGMMTLQAMVAFAKYLNAKEAKQNDVTVTMLVGADGKTNGPMLTLLALGADGFETLNRGGFYSTKEGQPKHFSEYFEAPTAMDLYQDLGINVLAAAKQLVVAPETIQKLHNAKKHREAYSLSTIEQFSAFQVLTKALDKDGKVTSAMRNLVKTPLTSFFFGSAMKSSVKGMEDKFIESFYTTIEDLAQGSRTDITLVDFIKATNTLLAKGNSKAPKYSENLTIEEMLTLKHALTPVQETALRQSFNVIMGNSVKSTMTQYFTTFIDRRNKINKAIQASWETYAAVYADAYNAELDSLMEAGKIAYREVIKGADKGKKIPLHGLTVAQEKVLRLKISNILPVMHTAYSKEEDNIRAGIYMGKTEVDKSKSPILSNTIITGKGKVTTQSHVRKEVSPGVAGLPFSIHSLDSSVMHKALNAVPETMNVHDEGANGVDKIAGVATALNKATIENLLEYSPAHEAVVMLERLVTGLAQRVKEGLTSKETVKAVFDSWHDIQNRNVPEDDQISLDDVGFDMIDQAVQNAYAADRVRLTNISEMGHVDQYTWEGGQFEVTQEIRDRAKEQLGNLDKKPSIELVEAMRYLNKVRSEAQTAEDDAFMKLLAGTEMEQAPVINEPEIATPKMSDWGTIGEPAIESDPSLVALFAGNKVLTGKAVAGLLLKQLSTSDKGFDKAMVLILKQVQSIIPNSMTVTYVTSDTRFDPEIHANPSNSRGWYVPQGKGQGIYLLGNEFTASNLQVETVIHELLHAVLLYVTENAVKGSNAAKLVTELETLLAKVATEIKGTKFNDAITDIHELISWGLTNREFQTDVLMKIEMKSQTKGNLLITGMAKLFNSITDFLFDGLGIKRKAMSSNGLSILTANVSGLFQEAANNQGPVQVQAKSQVNLLNSYTTEDMYDALDTGEVSTEFGKFHKAVLANIVDKVFGPAGSFRDAVMKNTPQGALQVFTESLVSGIAPFASKLLGSNIRINQQEAYVVEQVEAAVAYGLGMHDGRTALVRNEMQKLYREMEQRLKPADRRDGSSESELYNTVFDAKDPDYLAKFAAMGLGHEQFNGLLKVATKKNTKILADNSPIGILTRLFSVILNAINGRLTQTFGGQQADAKLTYLVHTLVVLEQKREIIKNSTDPDWKVFLDKKVGDTRKGAKSTLNTLINSSMFKKNKNVFIRAGSNLFDVVTAPGRIKVFNANLGKIRDNYFTGIPGVVSGVFNDMKGHKPTLEFLLRSVKHHEGLRKQVIELTNGSVLESFANSETISNESKSALTKVILRTGSHVLLASFTMAQLEALIKDPSALQAEISKLETKLQAEYQKTHSEAFIGNARALGYQLVTGRSTARFLLRNAHNIASMYGSAYAGQLTEAQTSAATKTIDALVSLNALRYSPSADMKLFADVLTQENARTDGGNGVQMAMLQHKMLEEQALERIFEGNPVLMLKGYMPEVYNPHTDVKAATEEEGKTLLAMGYVEHGIVPQDPDDTGATVMRLYTLRDGGLLPWLSGIMSFTGMRSKGTKHHGNRAVGVQKAMTAAKQQAINKMHRMGSQFDPTVVKENFTVPLLNGQGTAVNYVHLMGNATKDSLLERDSRFDTVLGNLAGSIFDKENSPKNNRKAVQLLHDEFESGYAKDSVAFLEVGPESTNAELREIYQMLPKSTKEAIRDIWGTDSMRVRADTLDIMFGYRELSLSYMFDKKAEERNQVEQAVVWVITTILRQHAKRKLGMTNVQAEVYSQRGAVVIRRAENVWHALVKETKDIFVVKNGVTLLGNILSNKTTLMLYGVPFKDILANSKVAWEGAEDYDRDNKELFRLQTQLNTGYIMGDKSEIEQRIAQLEHVMATNPVAELIEAGLMPTIAEDMEAHDDDFAYKPGFVKKMEAMVSKLNPTVREVGNQIYMGHSTRGYKSLARITRLSDFTARYALYQHLTTQKVNPMTAAEAIQEASDAFINYDIPMHRKLHYLDKHGFLMFTKYFLRIQRVIRGRFREAPGKMVLLMTAQNYLHYLPSILDSSILTRFGNNPFNTGALQYFTAGDDLLTTKVALSIFK